MTPRRADGGRSPDDAGSSGDGDAAALFRRVGLLHLGAAGAVNVAVGVAILVLATGDTLLRWTIDVAAEYVTAQTLLRDAPTYVDVATRLLPALGVLAVAVGLLAVAVAYRARSTGAVRAPVLAALAAALNPLALPLAGIAVALVVLAAREVPRPAAGPLDA